MHEFGNLRNCEATGTMALIQCYISRLNALVTRRTGKFLSNMNWKAVNQSDNDVLNQIGRVQMRQVAP